MYQSKVCASSPSLSSLSLYLFAPLCPLFFLLFPIFPHPQLHSVRACLSNSASCVCVWTSVGGITVRSTPPRALTVRRAKTTTTKNIRERNRLRGCVVCPPSFPSCREIFQLPGIGVGSLALLFSVELHHRCAWAVQSSGVCVLGREDNRKKKEIRVCLLMCVFVSLFLPFPSASATLITFPPFFLSPSTNSLFVLHTQHSPLTGFFLIFLSTLASSSEARTETVHFGAVAAVRLSHRRFPLLFF